MSSLTSFIRFISTEPSLNGNLIRLLKSADMAPALPPFILDAINHMLRISFDFLWTPHAHLIAEICFRKASLLCAITTTTGDSPAKCPDKKPDNNQWRVLWGHVRVGLVAPRSDSTTRERVIYIPQYHTRIIQATRLRLPLWLSFWLAQIRTADRYMLAHERQRHRYWDTTVAGHAVTRSRGMRRLRKRPVKLTKNSLSALLLIVNTWVILYKWKLLEKKMVSLWRKKK